MHKRLDELRSKFKEEMPTTFTNWDRQKVLTKVKQGEKREPGVRRCFPRVLTAVVLTLAFVIGGYFLADQVRQINQGTHDEQAEEEFSRMFEDPAVRETVFSDDAEISAIEYMGNDIYFVDMSKHNFYSIVSRPNRFLVELHDDKSMDIFKFNGRIHKLNQKLSGENGRRGEKNITHLFKDPISRELLLGDNAEVSQIQYLGGQLYYLEAPINRFLITLDSEELLDFYAYKKSVSYPVKP